MAVIIDGKRIASAINAETKVRVTALINKGRRPKLAVFLVGDDKASETYVRNKKRAANLVGIEFLQINLSKTISKKELIEKITEVQKDSSLSGVIVQLPLPEPLYTEDVLNAIKPELDVDCLTERNMGKLVMGSHSITPPTPGAVMEILAYEKISYIGKNVTIVGTGALVGKPLAIMLMNEGASVTTCNIKTTNTKGKCLQADIIVSATGKKDLITHDMVKEGAVVIDAGVNFESGHMFGDVSVDEVSKKASHITPTPGGVGPITISMLLKNTITLAEMQ